jgi:amino acid transporter
MNHTVCDRRLTCASGWLSLVGQICGIASSEYSAAQMLLATISIGSGFRYSPAQHHVIGTMAALAILHATINSLSTAWLNRLTSTYSVFHITVLVAVCITLLVMQKDKHSATYVFTDVEPNSGWEPGFSFLFGFLSAAWTMTNCGATGQ